MKRLVILFALLFAIILICGCTTNKVWSESDAALLVPPTPTQETTFESVTPHVTSLITGPTPTTLAPSKPSDPIIGTWKAYSVPYDCTAFFSRGSSGFLKCGVSIVSETKQFSWENEGSDGNGGTNYQATEYTTDQGVTPTTIDLNINSSGYMFSSSLPSNAYLIKMPGN